MTFCRLDYWLISNTLHDLDIIETIKTNNAATSLDLVNDLSTDLVSRKMNCSLLDDEDYINDITEKLPLLGERKAVTNCRTVKAFGTTCLKYNNIRAHNSVFELKSTGEK